MIDDSAPHRVFKICELTRLIASHVLTSPKSAVNFSCVCRYLEEPVLSALWETQGSLQNLLKALPRENWDCKRLESGERVFRIVRDPSPEDWSRVRRYAPWMRVVHLGAFLVFGEGTLPKLRLNLPASGWFPALQYLPWPITEANLSYIELFFSPHLKRILIYSSWSDSEVPHDIFPAIALTISILPTSALQTILAGDDYPEVLWVYLKDSFSSVILRCGPSFTKLVSPIQLTDAVTNHLLRLPNLNTWRVGGPPPNYSASSFPPAFPPLTKLILRGDAARGWVSLFNRIEDHAYATQGRTPLSELKKSLESLKVEAHLDPILDASFASQIKLFRNLVSLAIDAHCHDMDGVRQCIFKLNNEAVAELAMALPQLEYLFLGRPCFEDTCATTVACLLSISVHCLKLKELQIHISTTNIVDDLKNISEDPRFQELWSLPKCTLTDLDMPQKGIPLDGPGFEIVANGMVDIFPSLKFRQGVSSIWDKLNKRIAAR